MAEISGTDASETLYGTSGNDTITGRGGNDNLFGGSGDDTFYIGGNSFGYDIYDGGDGADRVQLTSDMSVSSFLFNSANMISTETLYFGIWDVTGTAGNDVFDISGVLQTGSYDRIDLLDGDDHFTGYIGSDNVNGGAGNDTLIGGAGNDTLIGGSGNDKLFGGSGDDTFYISGNDFGSDTYDGGDGADRIVLQSHMIVSNFQFTASNATSVEQLYFGVNDVFGTEGNDVFDISGVSSTGSYDTIYLEGGNDSFVGYRGNDYVNGGSGRDTLIGGAGDDRLDGGSGVDLVSYSSASGRVTVNLGLTSAQALGGGQGTDTLLNIENVNGSKYGDILTGSRAANVLNGGAGNDVLNGGAGNDTLNGGAGVDTATFATATSGVTVKLSVAAGQNVGGGQGKDILTSIENATGSKFGDRLTGTAGNNVLNGGSGADILKGAAGKDTLIGGAAADKLFGDAGNDVLTGGAANDILSGGKGSDVFVFAVGNGTDRIPDWQNGVDSIRILEGAWKGARYDSYDDLTIKQSGDNTVISLGGTSITLEDVNASRIDASDFDFV